MAYRFAKTPSPILEQANAGSYAEWEFRKAAAVMQNLSQGIYDVLYRAPQRIFNGNIFIADGTQFDPGAGKGVYLVIDDEWYHLDMTRVARCVPGRGKIVMKGLAYAVAPDIKAGKIFWLGKPQ